MVSSLPLEKPDRPLPTYVHRHHPIAVTAPWETDDTQISCCSFPRRSTSYFGTLWPLPEYDFVIHSDQQHDSTPSPRFNTSLRKTHWKLLKLPFRAVASTIILWTDCEHRAGSARGDGAAHRCNHCAKDDGFLGRRNCTQPYTSCILQPPSRRFGGFVFLVVIFSSYPRCLDFLRTPHRPARLIGFSYLL